MADETGWEEFFRLLKEIDKYLDEIAAHNIAQIGLDLDKKIMGLDLGTGDSTHVNCRCSFDPEIAQLQQPIAEEEDTLIIAAAREYIRTIDGLSKNSQ